MCDSPRSVTLIHPRILTGVDIRCSIAEKPCAIMRHDNTTPHAAMVENSKYIGQRRANYNTENSFVEQLPRIITTSTDEPMK